MGSDFLLTFVRALPEEVDTNRLKGAISRMVDEMSDREVSSLIENWGYDDGTPEELRELVEVVLFEACEESLLIRGHRQMEYCNIRGVEYAFAGGMSWGDSPSDAFEAINKLAMAGEIADYYEETPLETVIHAFERKEEECG